MDWFPLWNSLRIGAISSVIVFFLGIFAAYYIARLPRWLKGILAGAVLSFARAIGEYGATSMVAGYTPGKTATVATEVYQLWRTGNDALAVKWVLMNVAISAAVLLAVNLLERKNRPGSRR